MVTDDELVRRLYEEHGRALVGYARTLLGGDLGRAEDVVQEALLRAWRHPESVGEGNSLSAWLRTVVRNLAYDQLRAARVRPQELDDGALQFVQRDDPGLDAVLVGLEVAEAMAAISDEHRAVVDALYFRDLSVAEAAAHLGIPVGTVKSRAHYALRALRAACEERGVLR